MPANVVATSELEWGERRSPAPFGGRSKRFQRLPLHEIGFHLEELEPGRRSCPLHDHLFEEEQFYLLSGTLTVTERLPDGARREFELRAPGDICTYPDSGKTNLRGTAIGAWLAARAGHGGVGPEASAAAVLAGARTRQAREAIQVLPVERRPQHVAQAALPEARLGRDRASGSGAALSVAAGARALFVHRECIAAGAPPLPLHRHRFNELALLVLSGRIVLRQKDDMTESRCELSSGDIAHWPANGAARQLWTEGPDDATLLAFGTDRPWNVIEFPELGELYSAALEETGRLERLDYYAGEIA